MNPEETADAQHPPEEEAPGAPTEPAAPAADVAVARRRGLAVDIACFVLIFGIALAIRLVYVGQLQASPWFNDHDMDPLFHHQVAEAFAKGETFMEGPYFRAPLYTWFLGIIYGLFGTDSAAPRTIQAVLGALNCGLLFVLGRLAFSRVAGVLAGLAAAGYWTFVYFDAELLSPVLIVFFSLLLLIMLVRAATTGRWWQFALAGVLLGASALTRPDILLFAPLLIVWILLINRRQLRRGALHALALFIGCVLVILPVTIRNYAVSGEFVLIGTYGGVNLYIGNNPGADGMTAVIPGDPPEWWSCYQAQADRARRALGHEPKMSEVSSFYVGETRRYFQAHSAQAVARLFVKTRYFWSHWEIPNNQDIYFITQQYTPIARYLPVGYWLIAPLGFLGLIVCIPRSRLFFPLWGIVLAYFLVGVLFFVTARFRVPAAMVLTLLAAQAVCWLVGALRRRQISRTAAGVLAVAAMALVVAQIPPGVDRWQILGHRHAGFRLARQGNAAEAERMLLEAAERTRGAGLAPDADTWHTLGVVRLTNNLTESATECFERALAVNPDYTDARKNLAAILTNLGRYQEALPHYARLVQTGLQDPRVLAPYGAALALTGSLDEGQTYLLRAIRLEPQQSMALLMTAQQLMRQRRVADSITLLRAGVAKSPHDAQMHVALSALLTTCPNEQLRDADEALKLAERAVVLTAGRDPLALNARATALAALERYAEAAEAATRARDAARAIGNEGLAQQLQRQLQHYQQMQATDDNAPSSVGPSAP